MNNKIISRPSGDSIFLKSKAKINLSLDVSGKREDGYHIVEMIMQTVSLYDDITLVKTIKPNEINITCSNKHLPCDSRNIAWKMAKLIFDTYPYQTAGYGIDINIKKRIPVAAGLAGGSGNAAAVLRGMDMLFNLDLSKKALFEIGLKIGADVPFCLLGGTMLAKNIGDDLTPLPRLEGMPIILLNPNKPLSTAKVYSTLDVVNITNRPATNLMIEAIKDKDIYEIARNSINVLEIPAISLLPEIADLKNELLEYGAINSTMSGSGPTVFGIFDNVNVAKTAYSLLKKKHKCYLVTTV